MMIEAFAVTEAGGDLKPFQYDPGPLGPHEVEIEVESCGICHSDLSMANNDWGMTQFPFVPGHEVVGRIGKTGSETSSVKVGDRVGLGWHSRYCQSCSSCHEGDQHLCGNSEATIVGRHGGFADKVRAHEASVFVLPEDLDAISAGPLFCGGVTVFNPLLQFGVKPTDRAAVIGIGGLGHMALQFLKAWGCEVTAFTSSGNKEEEALALGAHHVINSRDPEALQAAAGKFDVILSTVNVTLDWNAYIAALRPKGRLHFLGAATEPMGLEIFPMISAQRSISASPVGSPSTIRKMLEFAARHQIKPVVETFPMSQVNQAMDHLAKGKARYRVVLTR